MKKFNVFKVIQLALLILMTVFSVALLMQPAVKQFVFASTPATILFFVVWIILLASFTFLLIDFSLIASIKLNYHNLYGVAYSDPLSGIPNRFSCDTIIEKYHGQPLPENVGCVMIDFSNLPKINQLYDHATGNQVLKDFSEILSIAAVSVCFVGRNGGNKFLAIFEDCSPDKLQIFLDRIQDRVTQYNQAPGAIAIEYRTGIARNAEEHLEYITKLISTANARISDSSVPANSADTSVERG